VKQFWIFDFRFWIESQKNKSMNAFSSKSLSDNRKSAIQNRKLVGLSVIALVLVAAGTVAPRAAAGKNPLDRLSDRLRLVAQSSICTGAA